MVIIYIEAIKKINYLYKWFNFYKIKNEDDKIIIQIPITNKTTQKKIERILKKVCMLCYNNNITNCVLCKSLIKNDILKNYLYSNNINILDGSTLNKYIVEEMVEKIYVYKQKDITSGEITVLVNDNDEANLQIIKNLSQNVRILNIITNNIQKFNKLLEKQYYEYGILIRITSNYNINLEDSDIIINIDFPEEIINKINIPDKATILNIPKNINIMSKRFSGINIKSCDIQVPDRYKKEGFLDTSSYEADLYGKTTQKKFEMISNDRIEIIDFIGVNGIIKPIEFVEC